MNIILKKYRGDPDTNGIKPDGSAFIALIIDDSKIFRFSLRKTLVGVGYKVMEADTLKSGTDTFYNLHPDVTTLDLILPGLNGVEDLKTHLEKHPEMKRSIVVSSILRDDTLRQSVLLGVKNVFSKPINETNLNKFLKALKEIATQDS